MKKYIISGVLMSMFLGSTTAYAQVASFPTAQSAVSTNAADPSAPFTLSGSFSTPGGTFGIGCFQVRAETSPSYVNECDTSRQTIFGGSIVGGFGASGALSFPTGRLLPATTYFYRVSVVSPLIQNGAVSLRSQSAELSFRTPAVPVAAVPVPVPVPAPASAPAQPSTTITVIPDQTPIVVGAGVANQKLLAFTLNVTNEPVFVQSIKFHISVGGLSFSPASTGLLTGVTLVDATGRVIDGPFDVTGNTDRVVDFGTSRVLSFPQGFSSYALKGTVPATAFSGQTVSITTNLATDWSFPKGARTGKTIPLSGLIQMKPFTVRIPRLEATLTTENNDRTILASTRGAVMETYKLSAVDSSEDIRVPSFAVPFNQADGGGAGDINTCQMFVGTTPLNSQSPILSSSFTQFIFDQALIIPKGTEKTISLKCDIANAARGTFSFDLANSPLTLPSLVASPTNRFVDASIVPVNGGKVKVVGPVLTLRNDPLSPAGQNVQNGTLDFRVGVVRFDAVNEGVFLTQIGFSLLGTSSPASVTRLTVTDNGVIIGTGVFTPANRNIIVRLTSNVGVPKGGFKQLGVKVDFARVGPSLPGVAGDRITIGVNSDLTDGLASTRGTGGFSNSIVNATGGFSLNTFTLR